PSGRGDHVDERAGLAEIVEEFVAYAAALVRLWDQPSDIEQLDRDEASASLTGCILRLAGMAEVVVRTSLPNEGHASIRLDCCERIVCNLDRRERRRSEESGLADVRFPDDPQLHEVTNVLLPQVPLWPGRQTNSCAHSAATKDLACASVSVETKPEELLFRRSSRAPLHQRIQESAPLANYLRTEDCHRIPTSQLSLQRNRLEDLICGLQGE